MEAGPIGTGSKDPVYIACSSWFHRAMLVLLTSRSPITHAGRADLLDEHDYGPALCGPQCYAERLGGQLLLIHPPTDLNVSCRRCRASTLWT